MTARALRLARSGAALALAVAAAGCAAVGGPGRAAPAPTGARRLVERGDELVRQGRHDAALELYAQVAAEQERDALHARAVHALARLRADPVRGRPDYRAAHAAFDRLLTAYPEGPWRRDAEMWRAALGELIAQEERAARLERETAQLRSELWARATQAARLRADLAARDAEAARLRAEATRLRTALDRLKQVDLDDRRR